MKIGLWKVSTLTPVPMRMVLVRAAQRVRGLSPEAHAHQDITVPPGPVNATLTAMLRVESWWLRAFDAPFGSSLLCLAKKPA